MMTNVDYAALIRRHAHAFEPIPTGLAPRLKRLPNVRAVLFDIYGTMLMSASGDISDAAEAAGNDPLEAALAEVGLPGESVAIGDFQRSIEEEHQRLRLQGAHYPEVDIRQMWHAALLARNPSVAIDQEGLEKLALVYEMRVNPVWPMPGLQDTLDKLQPLSLGIVSNAQFLTPELFPPLVGQTLSDLGFLPSLCIFSFQHHRAKPGPTLFQLAVQKLADLRIPADETVYVGNDLKKDVWAAASVGFKTALFAGDTRSLRLHQTDPDMANVEPDVVLTNLPQLLEVVGVS